MGIVTRIKICGVTRPHTAVAAAEAGASAIGLVFVPGSPRAVTVESARAITRELPTFVQAVGVFVDRSAEEIRQIADAAGLHAVQLHGSESPSLASALAPYGVIRAAPFRDSADLTARLNGWANQTLSGVLIDAPAPPDALAENPGMTGGHGATVSWLHLRGWLDAAVPGLPAPLVLAGGLTAENVARAVHTVRPWAVDVSSGVESSRGVKSVAKIQAFCEAVREADAASV